MTIFRVEHKKNYTTVNNYICKDNRLSWKAKGIWLYAFSRPDDWSFHLKDLQKHATDGKDSIASALRELEKFGYLLRRQPRNPDGTLGNVEWCFFETPQDLKKLVPQPDFPVAVFPEPVNPPLLSTEVKPSTEKKQQQAAPAAAVVFFDCLKEVNILEQEKISLSCKFPEEVVRNAVGWALHPKTLIKTTLTQAIKWACVEKPAIPKDERDTVEENKKYINSIERSLKTSPHCYVEILNKSVMICFHSQRNPIVIDYCDPAFKEQLNNDLRKFDLI